MGRISNTRRATLENALARFLVDWCLEAPGLEIRGIDLHAAFGIWWRVQNRKSHTAKQIHENAYLDIQQMYRLLEEAQIGKESRQELGPRGRLKAVVWWLGLGLDQAKYQEGLEMVTPKPKAKPTPAMPVYQPLPKAVPDAVVSLVNPQMNTHININGTIYARAEIIRVTELSRRIVHFRSGEKLAYVVVFRNPEHRQQWVTEAEGQRIIKELQR